MAVIITWTHEWSSSDDGTVLGGADLGTLQSDIEGHSHTSGLDTFLALTDVPDSYTGKAGYLVSVKSTVDQLEFNYYADTDGTLAADSDSRIATQKATKTYVDTEIAAIGSLFGAWVDKSSSYGAQQAATDGFVKAFVESANVGEAVTADGYTDANADPVSKKDRTKIQNSVMKVTGNLGFFVKKGDYWKIVITQDTTPPVVVVWWIPLGS